jgi:hypothetical protein
VGGQIPALVDADSGQVHVVGPVPRHGIAEVMGRQVPGLGLQTAVEVVEDGVDGALGHAKMVRGPGTGAERRVALRGRVILDDADAVQNLKLVGEGPQALGSQLAAADHGQLDVLAGAGFGAQTLGLARLEILSQPPGAEAVLVHLHAAMSQSGAGASRVDGKRDLSGVEVVVAAHDGDDLLERAVLIAPEAGDDLPVGLPVLPLGE